VLFRPVHEGTPQPALRADSTFLTGLDFFAIGDVVSVFFDLIGLFIPKFFVPFVGVLTSGRIFQNFSTSSFVTTSR
jgi:hypothetical protein